MQTQKVQSDAKAAGEKFSDKLSNGLEQAEKSVSGSTHDLLDKVSSKAEQATEGARHLMSDVGEKFSHGYDIAQQATKHAASEVESQIKKHPLIAVAAAAGIGWVVGRYLGPRMFGKSETA